MRIQYRYPWKRDTTKHSSPWEPEQFTWLTINFHVRDSAHTYIHTTHLLCKTLQKTTKENNAIISVLRQVTTATVIRTVTLEYQWRYCCSTSKGRWQTLKVKLSAKLNKLFFKNGFGSHASAFWEVLMKAFKWIIWPWLKDNCSNSVAWSMFQLTHTCTGTHWGT